MNVRNLFLCLALLAAVVVSTTAEARFVAVGAQGTIRYSDDAVTWYAAPSPTDATLTGIATNSKDLVAVDAAGGVYTSDDGKNWTQTVDVLGAELAVPGGVRLYGVRFLQGVFYAFGHVRQTGGPTHPYGTVISSGFIWRSFDKGASWEVLWEHTAVSGDDKDRNVVDLAYGNGYYVAVGQLNGWWDLPVKTYRSTDLITWQDSNLWGWVYAPTGIAFGEDRFVLGMEDGGIRFSSNGGDQYESGGWQDSAWLMPDWRNEMSYDGETFYALADQNFYVSSDDGIDWTGHMIPKTNVGDMPDLRGIAHGFVGSKTKHVIVGTLGSIVISSGVHSWWPVDALTDNDLERVTYFSFEAPPPPAPYKVTIVSPKEGQIFDPNSDVHFKADVYYQEGGVSTLTWSFANWEPQINQFDICAGQEECTIWTGLFPGPGSYQIRAYIGNTSDSVMAWYITEPPEVEIVKPDGLIKFGGSMMTVQADPSLPEFSKGTGPTANASDLLEVQWQLAPLDPWTPGSVYEIFELGNSWGDEEKLVYLPWVQGNWGLYATVWTEKWGPITAEHPLYIFNHCMKDKSCSVPQRKAPQAGLLRAPLIASTSGKPFLSCRERFCDADQEVPPGFRGSARWNPCEGRPFEWWAETNTDPRDTTLTIDRIAVTETRQTLVGQADGPIDIGLSTRVGVREALGLSASCGHEKERTPGKDETPSKTR